MPLERVERTRGTTHAQVPQVIFTGTVDDWPTLPPVFPGASEEWQRAHQHLTRPGPDGTHRPARQTNPATPWWAPHVA